MITIKKLKFINNKGDIYYLNLHSAKISNFNIDWSGRYYFGTTDCNRINILESRIRTDTYTSFPNTPSYEELLNGDISHEYYWVKDKELKLKVTFHIYPANVVGASAQQGFYVIIQISKNGQSLNDWCQSYYQNPHPSYDVPLYNNQIFFYDVENKAIGMIIANKFRIEGFQLVDTVNMQGRWTTVIGTSYFSDKELDYYWQWPKLNNSYISVSTPISSEDIGKTLDYGLSGQIFKTTTWDLYKEIFTIESEADDDPNDEDDGSQNNPDYEDDTGGDGDHDDSSDSIPEDELPSISATSNGLITAWKLTSSQLEELASKLWSPDVIDGIKQFFTNPMSAILSLSIIPVSPDTTSGTIHLGGYNTGISSQRLTSDYVKVSCGSLPINRYYGSYLDYSPFTKISLILPYIGEVELDPDQVMQTTVSVSYHINCITGELCCYILSNDSIIATYSGTCSKQLPLSQTDYSNIVLAGVQVASSLAIAGVGIAGAGKVASAQIASGANQGVIEANTTAMASNTAIKASDSMLGSVMSAKINYKHSSQLGSGAGQLAPQTPFLIITRPNLDLASNYKSFTGYPCNKNLPLSSCRGFTQIEASNLSVPSATIEEIAEIKELLLKGVII